MRILIVDDEAAICQVIADAVQRAGYDVDYVNSGERALELLSNGDIDIALTDVRMPGIDGIELVRRARANSIETTFLIMTAYASVSTAIDAMRAGAYDYMIKPVRNDNVLRRIEQISNMISLRDENRALRGIVLGSEERTCEFTSEVMRKIDRLVDKVAPTDSTVLITGESGTGKGVIARQVHNLSPRHDAVFLPINCGAIPENLLESELFGHVKGAFTGADKAKKGLFAEADNGTVFLDEIGELPLSMQVKLLHVLEDKDIRAVGSERSRKVDVRIVAATNRDLEKQVAEGNFRQDLYFRLNVVHVEIPSLRDRREDIKTLLKFFIEGQAIKGGFDAPHHLDPLAEQMLLGYSWPGNVREIENVIERAHILADDSVIGLGDLPPQLTRAEASGGTSDSSETLREQVRVFEINVILEAIETAGGDRREASKYLGIGLSTLYRKLEEGGVLFPEDDRA